MSERQAKKILVVDDDEHSLMVMDSLLKGEGYATTATWSTGEALRLLRSRPFDLVLFADNPPNKDSEEFLEKVQRMAIQPQVVIIQRIPSADAQHRFMGKGASGVLTKWMTAPEISRSVREQLKSNALQAACA